MRPLLLVVVLVVQAFSLDIPCEDGEEIKSHPISSPYYMHDNWTYVYHWDDENHYSVSPVDLSQGARPLNCPWISITFSDDHFFKAKENECGDSMPFSWYDTRVKVDSPALALKDSIIFMDDATKNYLLKDCKSVSQVDIKQVSGNLMVIKDLDAGVTMLLSRRPMWSHDLNCLVRNLDVGKNLSGAGMCN